MYRLNLWNRDFFNALEFRNGAEIWHQTHLLVLFAAMSIGLAVTAVWGRMTFQRSWRGWVSRHLIAAWLGDERYRRLDLWNGEHQNAEYRIAEDARLATDAPIDLVVGLLASVLTAGTFVVVLWHVGGSLDVAVLGSVLTIPGYLVVRRGGLRHPDHRHPDVRRTAHDRRHRVQEPGRVRAEICRLPFARTRRHRHVARRHAGDDGGSRAWRWATSCANGGSWPGSSCARPTSRTATRCWRRWSA